MSWFNPQNPGIEGLDELTLTEEILIQDLAGLSYSAGDILYNDGTNFQRLPIGTDGQVLTVNDTATAPAWEDVVGGGSIDGSGTANEIAYWVDSDTLGALAVATYPSLTELSYVKGVTSAIQTQLAAKIEDLSSFDTGDLTEGSNLYFTDERAQDAVGTIFVDSAEIDFTYTDATPSITASIVAASIDETKLDASVNASLDLADSALQDVVDDTTPQLGGNLDLNTFSIGDADAADLTKLSEVTATSAELNFVDGVTSAIQTQIDGTAKIASANAFTVGGHTITVADTANVLGLTVTQNDTTNNPTAVRILNAGTGSTLLLESNRTDASGPILEFYQDSSSPAVNDNLGLLNFYGKDAGGTKTLFGQIQVSTRDTNSSSEDGGMTMRSVYAGTLRDLWTFDPLNNKAIIGTDVVSTFDMFLHTGSAGAVVIGSDAASGVLESRGNFDLVLQTGNSTTGTITITDGANGNINLAPNGTGRVQEGGTPIARFSRTTEASSATPTPTGGFEINHYSLTALATAPTFAAPSGTPAEGNVLRIRIHDNGTARALAWNAIYTSTSEATLPTTTVLGKEMFLGFLYDSTDSKWRLVAIANEA